MEAGRENRDRRNGVRVLEMLTYQIFFWALLNETWDLCTRTWG